MDAKAVDPKTTGRIAALLVVPAAGLIVLLALPTVDRRWEHHPSHFWLVLICAVAAGALAISIGATAQRRADARLLLVALSYLVAAGFFGLHALATPGVLLDHPNAGFVMAMPVGLLLAAGFAVWSSLLDGSRSRAVLERTGLLRASVFLMILAWAVWSLTSTPPLNRPLVGEPATAWLWMVTAPALVLYGIAAARYFVVAKDRGSSLVLGIGASWVLLAEAQIATAVSRSWHASWWEWHVLVLVAFGGTAIMVRRLPASEPFADLYLDEVAAGRRTVTVLFADLVAFSTYSESHSSEEVQVLVNTYFDAVVPAVVAIGGRVDRYIGDAVMVTWNVSADQPDHARRAAVAGLRFQQAAAAVAREHPDWPVFRVGINTGEATVGLIGGGEERGYSVVGDTVNVAARLEGQAPPGGIVVSGATMRSVPGATVQSLGEIPVKGRTAPVEAWLLTSVGEDRVE